MVSAVPTNTVIGTRRNRPGSKRTPGSPAPGGSPMPYGYGVALSGNAYQPAAATAAPAIRPGWAWA